MKGDFPKWLFTFTLLLVTVGWFLICIQVAANALLNPTTVNILEVAGASAFGGALISWMALCIQYWFRKSAPKE